MIEFLLGIAVTTLVFAVGSRRADDDRAEILAENHQLRAALRYIRDLTPSSYLTRAYVERLLHDEAGS